LTKHNDLFLVLLISLENAKVSILLLTQSFVNISIHSSVRSTLRLIQFS